MVINSQLKANLHDFSGKFSLSCWDISYVFLSHSKPGLFWSFRKKCLDFQPLRVSTIDDCFGLAKKTSFNRVLLQFITAIRKVKLMYKPYLSNWKVDDEAET